MGVVGVTETIVKPGVETDILVIESGDAGVVSVNLKEYQNSDPGFNVSIPLGWFVKLSV
jgi:hypothetical protein